MKLERSTPSGRRYSGMNRFEEAVPVAIQRAIRDAAGETFRLLDDDGTPVEFTKSEVDGIRIGARKKSAGWLIQSRLLKGTDAHHIWISWDEAAARRARRRKAKEAGNAPRY